jgi:glyoxylase-like metal-dependent hydrolase (beta-lactamase superfamily II)
MPSLDVRFLSVGPMDNIAYLLRCTATGEQLLIDAAAEPARLLQFIGPDGVATIVTTHQHADHWGALKEVAKATGAKLLAHPADGEALPIATEPVEEGDVVRVGEVPLEVIHLVGHTPGSIALYYDGDPPRVFTGDSLFPGGPGRTTNPEDFTSLMDDIEAKLFDRLPDETLVYPGHGKATSLGRERLSIPDWRRRGW